MFLGSALRITRYPRFGRWRLGPEVAGGLGERTVLDPTTHPPAVERVHYEFTGWEGADLVESFPCFLVTERLADSLRTSGLTGADLHEAEVTLDPQFVTFFPDLAASVPRSWRWLRPTGGDCSLTSDAALVVTDAALTLLQRFSLAGCEVAPHQE